jgi:hypothetical protein
MLKVRHQIEAGNNVKKSSQLQAGDFPRKIFYPIKLLLEARNQ